MVSSWGAMRTPSRAMISMSYLMFWPILRMPGSSSSGFSRATASFSGICGGVSFAAALPLPSPRSKLPWPPGARWPTGM